jgi:hypothetical protein
MSANGVGREFKLILLKKEPVKNACFYVMGSAHVVHNESKVSAGSRPRAALGGAKPP